MEAKLTFKDYNEQLKRGKLIGLKCDGCGELTAQPRMLCAKCGGSDFSSLELAGRGTIKTFTVNRVPAEGREAEAPYIVTIVELDEGPWVMGNLVELKPEDATIDIIDKKVVMSGIAVFPGDKYTAGDIARPLFKLV